MKYKFTIIGHYPNVPQITCDEVEVNVPTGALDGEEAVREEWARERVHDIVEEITEKRDGVGGDEWMFLVATHEVEWVVPYDSVRPYI